jgi:hypothetical protein
LTQYFNRSYENLMNKRLVTWVDANRPCYGSYFGRRNRIYKDHPDFRPIPSSADSSAVRSKASQSPPPGTTEPEALRPREIPAIQP